MRHSGPALQILLSLALAARMYGQAAPVRIDAIIEKVRQLQEDNQKLNDRLADLQKELAGLKQQMGGQSTAAEPHAVPSPQGEVRGGGPPPQASGARQLAASLPDATARAVAPAGGGRAARPAPAEPASNFSLLGLSAGPPVGPVDKNVTLSGRARYFAATPTSYGGAAVQAEGEYLYSHDRTEGQFDLGLVNRWNISRHDPYGASAKPLQVGLFSSFKHVGLNGYRGGNLLQTSATIDYLFSRGRVGAYGVKGFFDGPVIQSRVMGADANQITLLRVLDQVGASTALGLHWFDLEANAGLIRSGVGADRSRVGGMVRIIRPVGDWPLAVYSEFDWNETLLQTHSAGRVLFGVRVGRALRPSEYRGETNLPTPVDIPRVRYELRQSFTGTLRPKANPGPNQTVAAGAAVTLDGSASMDYDGRPVANYLWEQISGSPVSLSPNPTSARVTFTAAARQIYVFRLAVISPSGRDSAEVTVSSQDFRVVSYTASPADIQVGQTSTLTWNVPGAEQVQITPPGRTFTGSSGSFQVQPSQTTTYQLTATTGGLQLQQSVVVNVRVPSASIVFSTSPQIILKGQTAHLNWTTMNLHDLTISPGIGAVAASGTKDVSPQVTTTYTLSGVDSSGKPVSNQATVTIRQASPPKVLRFAASPDTITIGQSTSLDWQVTGAKTVTITSLGNVEPTGSRRLSPTATTTYALTAINAEGEMAEAHATVTIQMPASIERFDASVGSIARGQTATLNWRVSNAIHISISPDVGAVGPIGSQAVMPIQTTTYTLVADGVNGPVSKSVTVMVSPTGPFGR